MRVKLPDPKTGEMVDFLFLMRLTTVGTSYLNERLIPALRSKAGVPTADVRGNSTSHCARSTIASQLYNAREPMTLFELQQWLGHSSPHSTQHYAKITPLKVAKSYADAGYFARNLQAIEVLVDQDVVRSGHPATEPWKFYDLGHGYCTYDFFEQCQHRMAEQAAVEDGVAAYENLLSELTDVPTPAGPTQGRLALDSSGSHLFGRHCQLRQLRRREVSPLDLQLQIHHRDHHTHFYQRVDHGPERREFQRFRASCCSDIARKALRANPLSATGCLRNLPTRCAHRLPRA